MPTLYYPKYYEHPSILEIILDLSILEISRVQLHSVTEITPNSPSLCVNRSRIQCGFRVSAKATWYSIVWTKCYSTPAPPPPPPPTPPQKKTLAEVALTTRTDYSYTNDDVFSLASILNFSDSWFEFWSGEDLGVWGQSHIPTILKLK